MPREDYSPVRGNYTTNSNIINQEHCYVSDSCYAFSLLILSSGNSIALGLGKFVLNFVKVELAAYGLLSLTTIYKLFNL